MDNQEGTSSHDINDPRSLIRKLTLKSEKYDRNVCSDVYQNKDARSNMAFVRDQLKAQEAKTRQMASTLTAQIQQDPQLTKTWAKKQNMPYGFGTTNLNDQALNDLCGATSQLCTTDTASFIMGEDSQIAKAVEVQKSHELKKKQYQQILEKEQLRRTRLLADEELQTDAAYDSSFFNACSEMEQMIRQQEAAKVQDFNVLLAKNKKIKMQTDKVINEAENFTHIYNVLTSDLLLESSDNAGSALGAGRLRRGMVKNLSEGEIANIKAFQLQQIAEKEHRKNDEMLLNERYDYLHATDVQEFTIEKKQFDKDKNFMALTVQRDNLRLAEEQKAAQKEINRQARDNIPTEEFFKQFGSAFRKKQL